MIAGVDDTWTRRADVARALERSCRAACRSSRSRTIRSSFASSRARGAALVLSGHTHWGQIALPFVAGARQPLATLVSVSRWPLPSRRLHALRKPRPRHDGTAIRVGAPPEITVLRLPPRRGCLLDGWIPRAMIEPALPISHPEIAVPDAHLIRGASRQIGCGSSSFKLETARSRKSPNQFTE